MMRRWRCQVCKKILFEGPNDPLDVYEAGGNWSFVKPDGQTTVSKGSGWPGPPLAVCLGSWRNFWRRKWYHQECCGVYTDDETGRWYIFG